MADWDKIEEQGTIDDRRSTGGAVLGGGGLIGTVLVVAFMLFSGADSAQVQQVLEKAGGGLKTSQKDTTQFNGLDTYEKFAGAVLGSNNAFWKIQLASKNASYTPPKFVLFRNATQTKCGYASSDVGPFYCPVDQTVYLDETFFKELRDRFGAKGGDVAEAYVMAHEIGHHVQNITGTMEETQRLQQENPNQANQLSVRQELQADCYAGLWSRSVANKGVIEPGEISEAIDAAEAVGDDRIQKSAGARVNSETWTHGSASQRKASFNKGYNSTDFKSCSF
jgi:uncharacterized protein